MPSRLSLYNGALRILGQRKLASLTENREPRHLLDDAWNDDAVKRCLEQAQWKFAVRTQRLEYDPDFTREFGYQYAFVKPDDWVQTASVCQDEFFRVPLAAYEEEAGYLYAEISPLYVRFVSDDSAYGGDLSRWPAAFTHYVETFLASKAVLALTGDKDKFEEISKPRGGLLAVALAEAKSQDAFGAPPRYMAQGAWTSSRQGRTRGDRGRRGQLIGS